MKTKKMIPKGFKIQPGDQWVNGLGDTIVATDYTGTLMFRVTFGDKPDLGWGYAHTLELAVKAVEDHHFINYPKQDTTGWDDWTFFYNEPRQGDTE